MGRLTGPASVSLAPLASPNSNGGSFPRPSDTDDSREFWEAYSDRGSRRRLPTAALSLFLAFAIGIGMAG
ncbi:MAG TPA: hypothetical protein VJS68_01955, partial [Thermoplasmata archaeon]|nr:hypothetical protein [Thermoplasmata archaeon]